MIEIEKKTEVKSQYIWFFIIIVLLFALSSCYYDNTEDLYPTLSSISCDSGEVSFSGQILPLMNQSCNTSGCHNSIDRAAQIVLDNYTDLFVSANDGSLVGSMRFDPGFSPMPIGAAKLDNCSIQLVADWISQGALNN